MNEASSGERRAQFEGVEQVPSDGQLAAGPVATREIAQQILMGMQSDLEAQIDWRFQQKGAAARGVPPTEIAVILGSIAVGIPLTAIAGAFGGLAGVICVCITLVCVNSVWATRH